MSIIARAARFAFPGVDLDNRSSSSVWSNPAFYARAIVAVVLLSILAGIILRLTGYIGGAYSWFLLSSSSDDSWLPMQMAYERATGQNPSSMHDLFFVEHIKYQYPATSLLLYSLYDLLGIPTTYTNMNVLVWISILLTPYPVFRMCLRYMDMHQSALGFSQADKYLIAAALAVGTLFFYPIMIAWRLGQIQAIINFLVVLACWWWLTGRKGGAGALIGVTCLIKPQLSVFLIWAVLRGERRFAASQLAVIGIGTALSFALYGWTNNIFYFEVLSYLSRHGEIFWDNTSINGFVNRLLHPDQTLIWKYNEFAEFNPVVYAATLVSSIVIVGLALLLHRKTPASGSLIDFMTAGLSFTLASPIAWGHHYGYVWAMLAIAALEIARLTDGARRRNLFIGWAMCAILFSNYWNVTDVFAGTPLAFLQSSRLFAAIGLLWILYRLQYLVAQTRQDRAASTETDAAYRGSMARGMS